MRSGNDCVLLKAWIRRKPKKNLPRSNITSSSKREPIAPTPIPTRTKVGTGFTSTRFRARPSSPRRTSFPSSCGWPAFSKPIDETAVYEQNDSSFGMEREEVLSDSSNGHLGHVFRGPYEGPIGVRYCINGNALRFIPKEDLEKEGYGAYLVLFKK